MRHQQLGGAFGMAPPIGPICLLQSIGPATREQQLCPRGEKICRQREAPFLLPIASTR
jgi:hypothetical protein